MSAALIRRLLALAAALAAVVVLAPLLGFRWDPFDRAGRRIDTLEARLAQAETAAAASARLARAEAAQSVRLDHHHHRAAQATRVVADAAAAAQESSDADQPLPSDRADRLRDADRRLCRLGPDLCAAAPPQPAADDDGPVPVADPADRADPGRP